MQGRVLIIAGSDSSGGAGIQADIKTVTALGGYAMTAITALTAQNTLGVTGIHPVPADFLRAQIDACINDIGVDAIKTGMLATEENVAVINDAIEDYPEYVPLILDPVMLSKSKALLIDPAAIKRMQKDLFPRTAVLTPNIPEAELLTGMTIKTLEDMKEAAFRLLDQGPITVFIKGGHLESTGSEVVNLDVIDREHIIEYRTPRIDSRHTHGTGCTLASAIATGFAQDLSPTESLQRAQDYVLEAIKTAPGFGQGNGPLNHAWTVPEEIKNPGKKSAA